jgi:hypothetical protein
MTRKLRLTLASILAMCALGAIAPAADAYIYWTSMNGHIGRAENNGSNPKTLVNGLGSQIYSMAVGSGHIYWTDSLESGAAVGRAKLDGTGANPEYIYTQTSGAPAGLAVDSSHIYWAGWQSNTIGRVDLDGENLITNWIEGSPDFFGSAGAQTAGVAVNSQRIYWGNWRAGLGSALGPIGVAEITGSPSTNDYVSSTSGANSLALTPDYLFWGNYGDGNTGGIGRADIQAASATDAFITGIKTPDGVASDGTYIYWTNRTDGAIGRANINGTGVNQTFLPGVASPYGIAVDSLTSPTLSAVKLMRRSAILQVGCGDPLVSSCTVTLTGKKVGTSALTRSKTVTVQGTNPVKATIAYTPKLIAALRKGGRISIKAVKSVGGDSTLTGRVR